MMLIMKFAGREAKRITESLRSGRSTQFPKFNDHEAVQAFFLKEVTILMLKVLKVV